jgi:O-antigen/teichoic acid export membrane protein
MVLFASLGLVTETYASIKRRITVPKLLKEVGIRLLLSLGVVLYGLKMMNYDQALSFIIWGNGLLFVANTIYIYSIAPFDLRPDFTRISRVELKEWIKYSSIIFIGSFSGLILTKLDFVMVSSMLGMAETGIYSTMFYLGLVIEMPRRSLTQISAPIMAEHLHRNEMDKVKHLYQRSSINMLLVGVVLFLGLWINVEYLFELMPKGEIFSRGLWVFFFIALGKIANLAEGLAGIIISNSNFYRYSVLMSFITTAVAIGANLFLIPRYGMTGAAMATAFSLLILSLYSIAIVYHKLKVHPFVRAHLHLMIVLVVILLVNQILNIDTGMFWLNVLCTNIIILLPTLWLIWKLKISEELNDQLSLVIKRYWNK